MRIFKRALSLLLSILIITSVLVPVTAFAEEITEASSNLENLQVEGVNSVGDMLAQEYAESDEVYDEISNNIYEITVSDNVATVKLQTLTDARLIAGLYDEDGKIMLTSAIQEITSEDTSVSLTFNIDSMPEFFVVKAFLLDVKTNSPLCKQFECDTYTSQMQEFLSKSVDDFNKEKVLNLDENQNNNFMVYNDETVIAKGDEDTNVVTSADETSKVYVIENIDETISSLQVGDVFSHSFGEDILIVKIASITIEGTTATIIGEDAQLEEVFDYVRIDADQSASDATVGEGELQEGVEYLGTSTEDSPSTFSRKRAIDTESEAKSVLEYALDTKIGDATLKGSLAGSFETKVKCYYDAKLFEKDEIDFSFYVRYSLRLGVSVEMTSGSGVNIPLKPLVFTPVPLVVVSFTPAFVVEGKVNTELSGVLSGQIGKSFRNGVFTDNNRKPTFYPEFKVEGEVFIGLSLKPKVGIAVAVITATADAQAGVKIKAEIKYSGEVERTDEIHQCKSCLDGDVKAVLKFSFALRLMDSENLEWKPVDVEWSIKLFDFYYSFDNDSFDFTSCPNNLYKQVITVTNQNNAPIKDVNINGELTAGNGQVSIYLSNGSHKLAVSKDGVEIVEVVHVNGIGKHNIKLVTSGSGGSVVGGREPVVVKTGYAGYGEIKYSLYDTGLLRIHPGASYSSQEILYSQYRYDDIEDKVTEIIIEPGIITIGDSAFTQFENVTKVTIPNTVTTIKNSVFSHCKSLESVTIPGSVTLFGSMIFSNCTNLKSVVFKNGIKSVGYDMFSECYNLTDVSLPSTITTIDPYAFWNCISLESIEIPESVKEIGENAFCCCKSLKRINIPKKVTEFADGIFNYCAFESFVIPEQITSIGDFAFDGCSNLTTVRIPETVTSIGEFAFKDCTNLDDVVLPEGITEIKESTFENCSWLRTIHIPESVTKIEDNAFLNCERLSEINLPDNISSIGSNVFTNTLYYNDKANWDNYALYLENHLVSVSELLSGDFVIKEGAVSIADSVCSNPEGLTSVTFPKSLKKIGKFAFCGCANLEAVNFSEGLEIIEEYAFYECTSLTSVTIPDGVKSIGQYAFSYCTNLTDFNLPDTLENIGFRVIGDTPYYDNTDNWTDKGLFIGNYLLKIPSDFTGVYEIPDGTILLAERALAGTGVTDVVYPDSIKYIGEAQFFNTDVSKINLPEFVTKISYYMYAYCDNLVIAEIPQQIETIDEYAFYRSDNMQEFVINGNVTSIGRDALNSRGLKKVIINSPIEVLEKEFLRTSSEVSVYIPKTVKRIEKRALICSNLTIYYEGSEYQWSKIAISLFDDYLRIATMNYNAKDVYFTEIESLEVNSDSTVTETTISAQNFKPQSEVVLMIIEGMADTYELNSDTLLYITQATADENGAVNFDVYGDFSEVYWVALTFGECGHTVTHWDIISQASDFTKGEEACICDTCGEIIDSKIIEATYPDNIAGDVNCDGVVSIYDVTMLQKNLVQLQELDELQKLIADVNKDTVLDVNDVTLIQKYIVKLINNFDV